MPNTHRYEVEVKFDDRIADVGTRREYFDFLGEHGNYSADGIGHDKKETSTITINSEQEFTEEGLAKILGEGIPILSFRKVA